MKNLKIPADVLMTLVKVGEASTKNIPKLHATYLEKRGFIKNTFLRGYRATSSGMEYIKHHQTDHDWMYDFRKINMRSIYRIHDSFFHWLFAYPLQNINNEPF